MPSGIEILTSQLHSLFLFFFLPTLFTIKNYFMQQKKAAKLPAMEDLRKSLAKLQKEDFSLLPDTRMLKVHDHSRTNGRKPTKHCPEIILRGGWLEKAGFSSGDQWVYVIAMDEMIIITPQFKINKRRRLK
jgi:hypothetical protein